MYAIFGEIQFKLLTSPEESSVESSFTYPEQKLVEGTPLLQWVGRELAILKMTVLFHARFCNPQKRLDELIKAGQDHNARPLVYGNQVHAGYFVVTKITVTNKLQGANGELWACSVDLELKEFVFAVVRRAITQPTLDPVQKPIEQPPAVIPKGANYDPTKKLGNHNLLPTDAITAVSYTAPGTNVSLPPLPLGASGAAITRKGVG